MIPQSLFTRFVAAFLLGAPSFFLGGKLAAEELKHPDTEAAPEPTSDARQEVWRAVAGELRKQGFLERQLPRMGDLDLPGLAFLDGRSLRITSSCWDSGPRRTQFRVECSGAGQCLPFLVYFRDPSASDDAPVARARLCRAATPHHATGGLREPTVRAGGRATAVFHADGLRMTATVTSLERGREGEVIRVRAVDGHVFRVRILGPGQVEALPQ